jgi:hypothetical protein
MRPLDFSRSTADHFNLGQTCMGQRSAYRAGTSDRSPKQHPNLLVIQRLALGLIGHAAALGSFPVIPLLLRTVADSLFFYEVGELVLSPEVKGLLLSRKDLTDPGLTVPSYRRAWWDSPGGIGEVGIIRPASLHEVTLEYENQVYILFMCYRCSL